MTEDDWKYAEEQLVPPIGFVKLKADGYELLIMTVEEKPLHYSLGVFVDGKMRLTWALHDCEIREKFYRKKTRSPMSASEKKRLKSESNAIQNAVKFFFEGKEYDEYSPFWGSFKALKSHLIKHNLSIELIKEKT